MDIHSLPQLVSCFLSAFLFLHVSFGVAAAVPITEGVQVNAAQSTPPPAQPTPLPAADLMPAQTPASPTAPVAPPSASPTPQSAAAPPPAAPAPIEQKLLAGVVSDVRSEVSGKPASSPGCVTTECVALYPVWFRARSPCVVYLTSLQSVNVYYWPPATPNTACLSTVTDKPSPAPQPPNMYDK